MVLCDVWNSRRACCYARCRIDIAFGAVQYAVLTERMVLPGKRVHSGSALPTTLPSTRYQPTRSTGHAQYCHSVRVYSPTRQICCGRYCHSIWCYQPVCSLCAVTSRMVLPAQGGVQHIEPDHR
eukprot:3223904-Rhodomonas_salina.2